MAGEWVGWLKETALAHALDDRVFAHIPQVDVAIFVLVEQSFVDADVAAPDVICLFCRSVRAENV